MVSILKGLAGAMQFFSHDGFELAYIDLQPSPEAEPVLLIHGTDDVNIPIAHSRRLRYATSIPLPLWDVKGAGHVEPLSRAYAEYTRRVLRFFAENSGSRLPASGG